jgi:hypothetical protein
MAKLSIPKIETFDISYLRFGIYLKYRACYLVLAFKVAQKSLRIYRLSGLNVYDPLTADSLDASAPAPGTPGAATGVIAAER